MKAIRTAIPILFLFFYSHVSSAMPYETYAFSKQDDANRFGSLIQEVRCVVCQNQNIADSNAPLANDLREKIYHMVLEKKSNTEIKNFLVDRYGEFILLKPRFNKLTILLWLFPFIGLVFILMFFLRFNSANQRRFTSATRIS